MKLIITTNVWAGEFDPDEFPHYRGHIRNLQNNTVDVVEEIEIDPKRTTLSFEA